MSVFAVTGPLGNQLLFEEIPFALIVLSTAWSALEVAVDLTGPLLLWSWDPVWNFSSPADRDWHESDLRMFYSVSGPLSLSLSPSIALSRGLGVVSHWFQSLQQYLAGSSKPDILSWTFTKKKQRVRDLTDGLQCGSNGKGFYIILMNAYRQTL